MLRFHANLYALPDGTSAGPTLELRGHSLATLAGDGGGPPKFFDTLPVTFEQVQELLAAMPRCDAEPDGFFLLTGHEDGVFWRLNGHLNEYVERLHRVELNGECPTESLDALLRVFGWPTTELAFELVQEGVALGEAALRQYATA